ncbi:hypothetical protein TNCV_2773091 [Trichonephila clavipes]|nr:hypothetical protein TNCV_2773091 [Trichonephila clavipes]
MDHEQVDLFLEGSTRPISAANRVLAHRLLTTNNRRVSRLLALIWTCIFSETAEITSSPRPLSPSMSTNKEARFQSRPTNVKRPILQVWDGGTLRVPVPKDVQRPTKLS